MNANSAPKTSTKTIPLGKLLQEAETLLAGAGIATARLDAQLLTGHMLRRERSWLLAHPEENIDPNLILPLIYRRQARQPLAYLTGQK